MLNRHFPRRQPAICLSGPTNTVDAGQISSFPAVFQPQASKANRKGTVRRDILAWGQVACVLGSVYASSEPESTPHVVSTPHPTLPAFCSAWPPCLHCVCVLQFPPSHKDHCMGQRSPCLSFFASVYSSSRLIVMILSHATDQRHFVGKSADGLSKSPLYLESLDPF